MPYEPPSAKEKGLVTTAIMALGFGALSLPATAGFGLFTVAFVGFYRGLDRAAVWASCILLPVSSILCIILAAVALLRATKSQKSQNTARLVLIAWLSVPTAAAFWALVAKLVSVHR